MMGLDLGGKNCAKVTLPLFLYEYVTISAFCIKEACNFKASFLIANKGWLKYYFSSILQLILSYLLKKLFKINNISLLYCITKSLFI